MSSLEERSHGNVRGIKPQVTDLYLTFMLLIPSRQIHLTTYYGVADNFSYDLFLLYPKLNSILILYVLSILFN